MTGLDNWGEFWKQVSKSVRSPDSPETYEFTKNLFIQGVYYQAGDQIEVRKPTGTIAAAIRRRVLRPVSPEPLPVKPKPPPQVRYHMLGWTPDGKSYRWMSPGQPDFKGAQSPYELQNITIAHVESG
jgi:hypothetical protein